MESRVRKSGLKITGDFAWGTHFCQFYSTRQDLLDILVPYFKAGLRNNEFCMWITSEPLNVEQARKAMQKAMPDFGRYLRRRQIEILPHTKWYLKGGSFNQDRVLKGWIRKLERARKRGLDGLRLSGNTLWLEKKYWRDFTAYEEAVNNAIGGYNIIALCTYSLDKCGASEVVDVVNNHRFAIIKRSGRWTVFESSERKRGEERIKHLASLNIMLKLLSRAASRREYAEGAVKLFKGWSKCRCAGIRLLDEEGKIPYEYYMGFSKSFWESENWLSIRTDKCACIRVIEGKPEPVDAPLMTKAGSFYCNDTVNFVESLTQEEKSKFRGVCLRSGFRSVAVIPVRYKDKVIGAIHLADKDANKVSVEMIEFMEALSTLVGEAINKFNLEEKLLHAQNQLAEAKRLSDIGTLAATVAHELRSPLGVIRTAAYNVKRKAQNPSLETHLVNIDKKVQESDQIINNLLFYSRLKMPHIERVRLFDVLGDCIDSVKSKYAAYNMNISRKISSVKGDLVDADPLQMGELFNNILSNAYDASLGGKGGIEVSARKDDSGNVIVAIRDYGMGMDAEQLKRIFEPFYTTKAKGTGLGLTVCKQIVALHDGKIDVESQVNKGTTITLTLPLKKNDARANPEFVHDAESLLPRTRE